MGAGAELDLALKLRLEFGGVLELGVARVVGVVGAVWRVLVSWQSASAARKCFMASESVAKLQLDSGDVRGLRMSESVLSVDMK